METVRDVVAGLGGLRPDAPVAAGPGCEASVGGLLVEPVSAVTSLAFVVAGAVILAQAARSSRTGAAATRSTVPYALLVGAVGVGSVIQHGPDPAWSDLAHDAPLLATLAFVAADGVAALTGRRRAWWWWAAPTAAVLPVVVLAPRTGDLAQVGLAAAAVGLTLARGRSMPRTPPSPRRRIVWALALLTVGGVVGRLSRTGGPLCDPDSLWQGHGLWHVLAAAALVVLAPVIGAPQGGSSGSDGASRRSDVNVGSSAS